MAKVNIKERNFKILKFGKGTILQWLMMSGKTLTSAGTEFCVHTSIIYYFVTMYWYSGLTMAKVSEPCAANNQSSK